MAENQSSLQENLIAKGLNPNNPAGTYVDFAAQVTKNQREQAAAEEALRLAKEHVAQARITTKNQAEADQAGLNPLLTDTMTPEEARAYLKIVMDAKGLEIDEKAIEEWIATLPARVNRNTVELFANRFARSATRAGQPAKFEKKDRIMIPEGATAEELGLEADVADPRFGHVPEDGMYQVVYDNQGVIKKFIPGGKDAALKDDGLTPGQKKVDLEFAKDYNDYVYQGGAIGVSTKLGRLSNAISRLEKIKESPEASQYWDRAVGAMPDSIRAFIGPTLQSIEQDSRNNVLEILRQTLGAQFTEREGERIFSQTFGASLPPAVNAERMRLLLAQLQESADLRAEAMEQFYREGTVSKYFPKLAAAQQRVLALADSFLKENQKPKRRATDKEDEPETPKTGKPAKKVPKYTVEE